MQCIIALGSYGSYAPGKYGLTISRPGGPSALPVRYLKDDELRTSLSDLGYRPQEIDGVIEALCDHKFKYTSSRDLTESQIARCGL